MQMIENIRNASGTTSLCIGAQLPPGDYYWTVQAVDSSFVGAQVT
jgi:hypothetical protein